MSSDDHQIVGKAQRATIRLRQTTLEERNGMLANFKNALEASKDSLAEANLRDQQMHPNQKRLDFMGYGNYMFLNLMKGIEQVMSLPDPLDRVTLATQLDKHLTLYRVTCPIGVLLIIFEARPEVYVQLVSLAIKSGNAIVLKGGKEAQESLTALHKVYLSTNLDPDVVHLLATRDDVAKWLQLDGVDLVIPRGSKNLIQWVQKNTSKPVLAHSDGICTIYIHEDAPYESTWEMVLDAKISYPAACNSVETILVHTSWPYLETFLKELGKLVKVHVDPMDSHIDAHFTINTEETFRTEFSSLQLCVHRVQSQDAAIEHIQTYSSQHTDAIFTEDKAVAEKFLKQVDSACVFWNCSTRFSDGYRFGFGAEVGISTNRVHARGPVGLEGLVIYKYQIYGQHHLVQDYVENKKQFQHIALPFHKQA